MQKDKAKQDERKKGKGFFVEGTETLVVLLIHVSIGVAARHNVVAAKEKEKRKQKKREKQDKKKEKRRRNQWVKMGMGYKNDSLVVISFLGTRNLSRGGKCHNSRVVRRVLL